MPVPLILLLLATGAFVAGHIVLSHPLRAAGQRMLGAGGFRAAYSAVAAILLVVALFAFRASPHVPVLWADSPVAVVVGYDLLTYVSMVLFAGSLFGNPARHSQNRELMLERPPRGTFLLTRHPMSFAIALWSIAEIVLVPAGRQVILFGGMVFLAIVGAAMQDRKLAALLGEDWRLWMERTPFWPDLRHVLAPGINWLVAVLPWLLLTWLHTRLWQEPVGIWLIDTMGAS